MSQPAVVSERYVCELCEGGEWNPCGPEHDSASKAERYLNNCIPAQRKKKGSRIALFQTTKHIVFVRIP